MRRSFRRSWPETPDGAEEAMRTHLFNVAEAVQRGLIRGAIDTGSRGAL